MRPAVMKKIIFLALLLFVASSAFAGELLIPAVYRGSGAAGTLWRTEIVVSNVTIEPQLVPVPVTITFHADGGNTYVVKMPLTRREVIAVPDAMHDWFDVASGGGIVRITWDEPNARIYARARVYNVGEHGQYGQTVPALETNKLVTEHFLAGLTGVDGNRTNVGISNPFAQDTVVWLELIDTAGESHGAFATVVPARSYKQFNDIFSYFQVGPLNAAMVRVVASDAAVYAYASIVRNDTGDASFVTAQ